MGTENSAGSRPGDHGERPGRPGERRNGTGAWNGTGRAPVTGDPQRVPAGGPQDAGGAAAPAGRQGEGQQLEAPAAPVAPAPAGGNQAAAGGVDGDGPVYDVAIIGGGPAGLFAAFYAGLRGMRAVILEAAGQLGGQPALVYPEKWIYDVAGFPRVRGRELAERLIEQGLRFGAEVRLHTRAETLEPEGDDGREEPGASTGTAAPGEPGTYRIGLQGGGFVRARGVVVAAGLGAFEPKRLPAPGLDRWEGRGLSYGVRRLEDLRGKRVVIVGGGDAAVDWALMALDVAASVTLVHRRRQFRALEESVRALRESPVRLELDAEVVDAGGGQRLEWVRVARKAEGTAVELPCDVLVPCLGFKADLGGLAGWGFAVEGHEIVTGPGGETTLPRVYAVGDVARYPGKIKLIAVGFAEAAMAISQLKTRLDPEASLQPAHSSDLRL